MGCPVARSRTLQLVWKCHGPISTVYFILYSNYEEVSLTDLHARYVECMAKDIFFDKVSFISLHILIVENGYGSRTCKEGCLSWSGFHQLT